MNKPSYHLEVNSEQAHAIIKALDLFSRIGMGQMEEVEHFLSWHGVLDLRDESTVTKRDEIRSLCDQIKVLLGHPVNGHYGIAQEAVPKACRIAYDLQCVLRQKVAGAEGEGPHSVWHHDPMHLVKDVPLAKCTVTTQEQS